MRTRDFLFILFITAFLIACDPEPKGGADEVLKPDLCQPQIAAWQIELQSYNQNKINHDTNCLNLNNQQTNLNNTFSSTEAEWPLSISYLRSCYRNPEVVDKSTCLNVVCAATVITSDDNCNRLINDIRQQFNVQNQIFASADQQKCTIDSRSAVFDMENVQYSIPAYNYPTAPSKPTCAQE